METMKTMKTLTTMTTLTTPKTLTTLKTISLSFILFLSATAFAASEAPDTLMMVDTPSKVIITESPEGTMLNVTDSVSGSQKTYIVEYASGSKVSTSQSTNRSVFKIPLLDGGEFANKCGKRGSGWTMSIDGVCVGLTNALGQTGGGGLQWSKSFEISWLSCLNVGYDTTNWRIYLGLGFDWRNYKSTLNGQWLVPSASKGVEWGSAPEGAVVRSTNLKVFSLQMPLMYVWAVPKSSLKFKGGPILCFNTHSSIKGSYDDEAGNRCEYITENFKRNPVTLDLFGSFTYHNAIGVYVRYSPMKVLKDPSPINFTPFTVGVGFFI